MRTTRLLALLAIAFGSGIAARPTLARLYRGPAPTPDPATPVAREPHRHAAHLRQLEQSGRSARVVLFGDSLADHWRDYPDQFARLGGALNFGVGSDCTEHTLWRVGSGLLDPAKVAPKVVVVLVGTNNLYRGDAPEAVARGVAAIAAEVRRLQPQARVVVCAVPPRGDAGAPPAGRIDAANRLLAALPGVTYLAWPIDPATLPDGLHFEAAHYAAWADALLSLVGSDL